MRAITFLAVTIFCLNTNALPAQGDNAKAQELAKAVWKASGGENWSKLKELHFTFVVEQDGNQLARAEHHWMMSPQTDHVKWKDKDVTVNLSAPPADDDAKAAFGRWTNDSYWLLAPLKILDPGVKVTYEGEKEADGAKYETLRLSFGSVGLTPGDQYVLYIDPQEKLVRAWDYIPKPESVTHATWEKYEDFGGLKLATEHKMGDKVIRFADVKAVQ